MYHETKTILVTGGAGYIGSHTCKALAQAGYTPVVYDSLCRGNPWAVKWGPLEIGDLMDGERLRDVLRAHRPVGVIHFAAFAYIAESMSDPLFYYRNNVGGTMSLLRAMAAEGVKQLVFSSTCATYGTPASNPIREDMPQNPINPYGQSKLMVEQVLRDCTRSGGLKAVALRYFNAAGADADCEIGEAHDPETHLIPLALGAAKGTAPALTVFGDDHDTPDGTCIRDYIHVADLADAHVRALGHTGGNDGFAAFNLGTGTGVSIKNLITAVEEVTGCRVPFSYGPRRDGDPAALVADPTCASEALGWKATQSDLQTILRNAWAWMERKA
ncbi:UDP-glucose 4-epimerase GalE [Histidinibacterium lentulum]|uniref:UDP-glucose 4-epimerase n=1 Tax=Histidinibacterium lentulum TaxID=2480588 RepID=A0A3N2QVA2_9RHOB|nr:UDP-glucose 4-epimerase GalE [Histidinibacterium lentulum]ROT99102.1 UDP-glucose 4-epimerase GalE [Histidinibacterium lentulum]